MSSKENCFSIWFLITVVGVGITIQVIEGHLIDDEPVKVSYETQFFQFNNPALSSTVTTSNYFYIAQN